MTSWATIAADCRDVGGDRRPRQLVGQPGQADQLDAGQVGHGRVDVVRQRQVDDRERAASGACGRARDRRRRQDHAGGAGAGHQHVGGGDLVRDVVERDRCGRRTARRGARRWPRCGWRRPCRRAPRRATVATARPAIAPGADDDDALAGERADVRRSARSSATETSDGRGPVDVGLGVRPLADAQRLLEQRVEGGADGAALLADPQRLAGLAEDLALADDHRVEAGGDVEQVGDRAVVVVDVEVRHDVLGALVGRARTSSRETASTLPWKRSTSA